MFRTTFGAALILLAILPVPPGVTSPARTLTFENRVTAQRAIEEVYWRHRTWPADNPTPKPGLEAVMPGAAIRAKVEDYLRMSSALETWWRRPITAEQLQAEMDRMATGTRSDEVLRELFAALGNDPFVIAETLARQGLAERLARSWYKRDPRFHDAVRGRAEEALARSSAVADLAGSGVQVTETTWKLDPAGEGGTSEISLSLDDWKDLVVHLASRFGIASVRDGDPESIPATLLIHEIPVSQVSPLREEDDAFEAAIVLERRPGRLTVATLDWPKTSFDAWWRTERPRMRASSTASPGTYRAAVPRTASGCVDDTWRDVTSDWPTPRAEHTAVWTGTEMIVWGGSAYVPRTDGWRYRPATDMWVRASSQGAPVNPSGHSAVWTGTEMIVWGGSAATSGRYDPVRDSWRPISSAGAPSATGPVVWTGSEMIVWDGSGGRYDPASDSWRPVTVTAAPAPRLESRAVWTGTEMIVWGGRDALGNYLDTGGRYDPRTNVWAATPMANAPSRRSGHSAVWTGSEMIVWGGYDGGQLNSGARYDPRTNAWRPTSDFDGTNGHSAVWTGREMIVWGGRVSPSIEVNTGGRYDPVTDSWTPTSSAHILQRRQHSAIWTGEEMIVWGGFYSANIDFFNNGARYDPRTDTWIATSTGTSPSLRSQDTATWTGSEMIVSLGYLYGTSESCAEGSRAGSSYDPATDRWRVLPVLPLPQFLCSGIGNHTAVWTGVEMILWGGRTGSQDTFQEFKSGFRFHPGMNRWTSTSEFGAPTERFSHTAVWTGGRMLVWGGHGPTGELNSGAAYDPQNDGWTPTSTTDAPDPRSGHAAVWTGERMIVWGAGDDDSEVRNTGGLYSPVSDSWLPTTTVGAPPPGQSHALWTGTEMIVWEGTAQSSGRYDPVHDSWRSISAVDAPDAPGPVVWTGTEMIAWKSTGGRYDPVRDAWRPTSAALADIPYFHTAVWTGDQMIVWGATGYHQLLYPGPVGESYCACSAPVPFFRDADGDGHGDPSVSVAWCGQGSPEGYVSRGDDCGDADPSVHPGAAESCNRIDDDCDGLVDEDARGVDSDGDGVHNACDNCPVIANPRQMDTDHDGRGNACDPCPQDPLNDADHDGICGNLDACPASIPSLTVVIGDCDSHVPNRMVPAAVTVRVCERCGHDDDRPGEHGAHRNCRDLRIGGNGCAISDDIRICQQVTSCPERFRQCVDGLTKELKKKHILTQVQRNRIVRCIGRTHPPANFAPR